MDKAFKEYFRLKRKKIEEPDAEKEKSNKGVSYEFLGKPYPINNLNNDVLKVGDDVIIHPTRRSISREPFEVFIKESDVGSGRMELCTQKIGGYQAFINQYLFDRMELKK